MSHTVELEFALPVEIEPQTGSVPSTFLESDNLASLFLRGVINLDWFSDSPEYGENPAEETINLTKCALVRLIGLWSSLDRISVNGAGSLILVFKDLVVEVDADQDITFERISDGERIICKFADISTALARFIPVATTSSQGYELAA